MKVIAIAHRSEKHAPEEFAPHLDAESAYAINLYSEETVRELYSRTDGKGAVLVLEVDSEAEARRIVDNLPLAKAGLLSIEIYGVKPYRGFVNKS